MVDVLCQVELESEMLEETELPEESLLELAKEFLQQMLEFLD